MATRRGNKSTYVKPEAPPDSTPEARWRERISQGNGFSTAYERASRAFPSKVSHENLLAALDVLASAFGDVAFSEAAIVLRSYNFSNGALKRQLLNILAVHRGKSTDAAIEVLDQLVEEGNREREAARIAVEAIGVEGVRGATFDAVVDEVRKARKRRRTRGAAPASVAAWPSGDTGRRMKVAMKIARPGLISRDGPHGGITRMPPEADPCEDGSFIVPDNRLWRRAVRDGFAIVLERLPAPRP